MTIPSLVFVVVVVPVIFFMFVWIAATVCRLYFPKRPVPFFDDEAVHLRAMNERSRSLPVGVRQIQADQRRYHRERSRMPFEYVAGEPSSVPEAWMEELWKRRN